METINPTIYREYDIRGIADVDFSIGFAELLGRALGSTLREKGEQTIAVGRDCRLTSEKYTKALVQGLRRSGIHVISLGICPTPLMYFSLFDAGFENGVEVTGSHNPGEYNGFKICIQRKSLYGKQIQDLRNRIEKKQFVNSPSLGTISLFDVIEPYVQFMQKHISCAHPLKIVVDSGNGTAGPIAPLIFRKLGCHVSELFCEMDGQFPNHFPDPTVQENLQSLVQKVGEEEADLGIAFDGDADRLGVVAPNGEILWGDELMILYSREILKNHPGAAIIAEVKCSRRLFSDIEKQGGKPIMWKTGHSLIKAKMQESKALLAGEMSGHLFFADRYYGYDDAIYAACRLIEIVSNAHASHAKSISDLLSDIPKMFSTPEIRIDCPDEKKFQVIEKAKAFFSARHPIIDIDGIRIEFPDGWALLRASNTQPVLVLRFEASSAERLSEIRSFVEEHIAGL